MLSQNSQSAKSRNEGSIFAKVTCAIKEKVVGWAKDMLFGSQ